MADKTQIVGSTGISQVLADDGDGTFSPQVRATPGLTYTNITTAGTIVVKAAPGTLDRITINQPGSAWVLTLYDSLTGSGTKIGTITIPASSIGTLSFGVRFLTGLTIVSSGTTPGDCTVGWL